MWRRLAGASRYRAIAYALAGAGAVALLGPWLVLVLLACGVIELGGKALARGVASLQAWPLLALAGDPGGTGALVWTALKVGALAFGGGFVIIPLMQSDAVTTYHWMTHTQFLSAVALGQITPGPVTQTVAAVGYSAGGLGAGLLAATVAFAPSFSFILFGAARFERLLVDQRVRAFLAGAAPAAAGAIIGSAVPLAGALVEHWQYAVLALAAIALLLLRQPVVPTLLGAAAIGVVAALLGAPISH
jgi:chromate transporter